MNDITSKCEVQDMMNIIETVRKSIGLEINEKQKQYLKTKRNAINMTQKVRIRVHELERLNYFTYVRVKINKEGPSSEEVTNVATSVNQSTPGSWQMAARRDNAISITLLQVY